MSWNEKTYRLRIGDEAARYRHPAGSPNPSEVEAYDNACRGIKPDDGPILILGMTPELRRMATTRFTNVLSIDRSEVAIELFKDWLTEEARLREQVIHGCWTELGVHIHAPPAGILGDGIIGNFAGHQESSAFLTQLRQMLGGKGFCVMRNVVLPQSINPKDFSFERLLERHRDGDLDAAEFGFTTRMLGFFDIAYDEKNEILDNSIVYGELDRWRENGLLSDIEWDSLDRYRFMGKNFFPGESTWKKILRGAGFKEPLTHFLTGKLWYAYYPVQSFSPV